MRVVVDTNVWVSAAITPDGPPWQVVQAVREGRIDAVSSWELVEELAEVLSRPKLTRYGIDDRHVRELLVLLSPFLPSVDVDVPIRDPDDAPVVSAAVAAAADAIVTGDRDLLADDALREWLAERGVQVLSPAEIVRRLAGR